jgi:hypothetical protein
MTEKQKERKKEKERKGKERKGKENNINGGKSGRENYEGSNFVIFVQQMFNLC